MTEFNDRVIAQFRANRGRVGAWGTSLVLIHHRGARTGTERVNPAMSLRDGDGWLVVGSARGAAQDPAWATNLRANPDVEIEAVIEGEIATVPVHATELSGESRRAAFARFVQSAPAFETYQERTARPLPVIRLSPQLRETEAPAYTRDALVARLIRTGELEVSGEHQDELPNYFDTGRFAFHGPDGFDSDYDGLNAYFASIRAAFDDRTIRRGIIVVEGNRAACQTRNEPGAALGPAKHAWLAVDARQE